jgi:hypothetical protein
VKQATKTQPKDRGSLTLAELLEADTHAGYLPGDHLPNLTIPARDWLKKFVAGEDPPYGDSINPDDYKAVELVVALLMDQGGVEPDMLPSSALDYVEEWLYRLEESTDLHVWNVSDIARPFLAHVFGLAKDSDSTEGAVESLQTTLRLLCTEEELGRFYERHGLNKKDEGKPYRGSQAWRDHQVAIKAARVLADPSVSDEIKNPIRDAINDLSSGAGVPIWHPALVERGLTLMFATNNHVEGYLVDKASTKQNRKRLRDLVNAVPEVEHTHKPANFKNTDE